MIRRWIFALGLFSLCIFAAPYQAYAFDIFSKPCEEGKSSALCKDSQNPTDPIAGENGVLLRIVDIIAYVAGIAAIVMLIVGGIYLMTANGDANNIKSARNTILNAIIGIAVIVMARTLIVFVIKKL